MKDVVINLEDVEEPDDRPIYELVVRTPELMIFAVLMPHDTLDKLNSDQEYKSYKFVSFEDEELDIPSGAIEDYFPVKDKPIDLNEIGEWYV